MSACGAALLAGNVAATAQADQVPAFGATVCTPSLIDTTVMDEAVG